MRPERTPLRLRLLRWLLPPVLALTALWIWATHGIVLHFANLAYDRALEDSVRTLAGRIRPAGGGVDVDLPPAARQMLVFDEIDTVHFSVTDRTGRALAGSHVLPGSPTDAGGGTVIYDGSVEGRRVRLAEFVVRSEQPDQDLFVRVAETLKKREVMAQEATAYMLAPQAVFVAGLILLLWYGVGRGIAPLHRISRSIARRSHADLGPIDENDLPAEVYDQVHVINDLMARLGRTIDAQRRFIADATHQLRTPVTVLRTLAELALRTPDGAQREQVMRDLQAASARLSRVANQLLNLSRAEAGAAVARDPIDLRELVEDVVAAAIPTAVACGTDVRMESASDLPLLHGDRVLLPEMLANIVDNALRYTPPGGQVVIRVDAHGKGALISVSDSGPGIAPAQRTLVLGRFGRGKGERREGSGLGLAIAREIALAHGGHLDLLDCAILGGLRVDIFLPTPTSEAA
ncbi:sensor histidine kinase [Methyloversatilis sp.]|uniref:sensor histidine kinase n=1 Tax=Methyloversatilis sp. TaxID=2569862 RepID=UPI0027B9D24C|nr:sensor histidine kinase [Methyloversatilis sp.]